MIQNFLIDFTEVPHFIGQLFFVPSCRCYVARVGCRTNHKKKAARKLKRTVVK